VSSRRVVIAGGSGFIGRAVVTELQHAGYEPIVLSRTAGAGRVVWDDASTAMDGAAGLINLVGEPINQPWTPEARTRILNSRVGAVRRLADLLRPLPQRPLVWVQGSATGYYGDRGDEVLDETSMPGRNGHFLVDTCLAWEDAFVQACPADVRPVRVRTGFVLGKDGGAFPLLAGLTRRFLGGAVGNGQQWLSWIHLTDIARMLVFAVAQATPTVLNGTAPEPARNGEFMAALRHAYGRPWVPPAPAFAMSVVGKLGGPDPSLVLESQHAVPNAALAAGFTFTFARLDESLRDLTRA